MRTKVCLEVERKLLNFGKLQVPFCRLLDLCSYLDVGFKVAFRVGV